jgi:hypothetical protein
VPRFCIAPVGDLPQRRRRPGFTSALIVIVIVMTITAPVLNPQQLAVVCAVLGGLVPLAVVPNCRRDAC